VIKNCGRGPALGAQSAEVGREVVLWLKSRRTVTSHASLSKGGRPPFNPPPRSAAELDTALQRTVRAVREGRGGAHLLYRGQRLLRGAAGRVTDCSLVAHIWLIGM
jgi:hypothetical protein